MLYCLFLHSLSYLLLQSVLGYNLVPPAPGPPFSQCYSVLCWLDGKGSGVMTGEPLSHLMDPDTNISLVDANGFFSNRTGDIGLFKSDYESYLDSAVLGTTILRDHDRFSGWITNTDGDDIGHMNVERPVPDPETLFHDLVQDSLVAAIPTALRSEVDPNSLIPSPTQGCESKPTECYIVIPVRSTTST